VGPPRGACFDALRAEVLVFCARASGSTVTLAACALQLLVTFLGAVSAIVGALALEGWSTERGARVMFLLVMARPAMSLSEFGSSLPPPLSLPLSSLGVGAMPMLAGNPTES